jgi:hypothetical protein
MHTSTEGSEGFEPPLPNPLLHKKHGGEGAVHLKILGMSIYDARLPLLHVFYGGEGWGEEVLIPERRFKTFPKLTPSNYYNFVTFMSPFCSTSSFIITPLIIIEGECLCIKMNYAHALMRHWKK